MAGLPQDRQQFRCPAHAWPQPGAPYVPQTPPSRYRPAAVREGLTQPRSRPGLNPPLHHDAMARARGWLDQHMSRPGQRRNLWRTHRRYCGGLQVQSCLSPAMARRMQCPRRLQQQCLRRPTAIVSEAKKPRAPRVRLPPRQSGSRRNYRLSRQRGHKIRSQPDPRWTLLRGRSRQRRWEPNDPRSSPQFHHWTDRQRSKATLLRWRSRKV